MNFVLQEVFFPDKDVQKSESYTATVELYNEVDDAEDATRTETVNWGMLVPKPGGNNSSVNIDSLVRYKVRELRKVNGSRPPIDFFVTPVGGQPQQAGTMAVGAGRHKPHVVAAGEIPGNVRNGYRKRC